MVNLDYLNLSTRAGFNKALRHFKMINAFVEQMTAKKNLADIINEVIGENFSRDRIVPTINALLVDKFEYSSKSFNLKDTYNNFDKVLEEVRKWTALDFVIAYYHPQLKITAINPRNESNWREITELQKNELIVIYAKFIAVQKPENVKEIELKAINSLMDLIEGKDIFVDENFIDKSIQARKPAATPTAAKGSRKMHITPRYSVQVTNELFHNGNVEAWKNIIESYLTKHPTCTVKIYYDGELIEDINTLFKWGKVKHDDLIFFTVAGEQIKDVSKLKRYLFEGASSRFELFLKKDPSRVLNLF